MQKCSPRCFHLTMIFPNGSTVVYSAMTRSRGVANAMHNKLSDAELNWIIVVAILYFVNGRQLCPLAC